MWFRPEPDAEFRVWFGKVTPKTIQGWLGNTNECIVLRYLRKPRKGHSHFPRPVACNDHMAAGVVHIFDEEGADVGSC